ncbi:MAG: DUF3847 domain-containing protein [Clostridia bacterium]|nr:DUF3847 domain-containing protein [Clostridia bacterium]
MSKRMDQLLEKQKKLLEKKQQAEAEEKAVQKQIRELSRSERTHRLCTRGGYLEKLLVEPGLFSEEEIQDLLDYAFGTPFVKDRLAKLLEAKREAATEAEGTKAGSLTD